VYLVRQPGTGGKPQLAVAEWFAGACQPGGGAESFVQEARRLAALASPNVARVREAVARGDDLTVFSDYAEGEKLTELWDAQKLPLEIAVRVVVDLLAGLGALHNMRDAKQQPLKLAHGEVSPATVALGLDGIARLLHVAGRRAPGVQPERASLPYLAPEVASGDPYDARADVFGAGVLLWEALAGARLFTDPDPPANAKRARAGGLPRAPVPPKAPWAASLVDVAAKALAAAPDDRWPTAAVLAAEIRKAAGLKLAPASTAAAFARSACGERVKKRAETVDSVPPEARSPSPPPVAARPPPPASPPAPAAPPVAASPKLPLPIELPSAVLELAPDSKPETVVVAPGVTVPVADVVELGSDMLIDAASSISSFPPPASLSSPSSAVGGVVLDPFSARPPPPPAVEAMRIHNVAPPPAPIEEPAPPSITGQPQFAAAIQPPPPTAPRFESIPVTMEPEADAAAGADDDAAGAFPPPRGRRTKLAIVGVVVGLGLVVLVLAGVQAARRSSDSSASTAPSAKPTAPAAAITPPGSAEPTPAAAGPSPSPAAPSALPAPAASPGALPMGATPVTPHASPPVVAVGPRPVVPAYAPPPLAATPRPASHTAAAPTPKPRPKPTFDPNSL
jgi:serine/threonine-protein kinase